MKSYGFTINECDNCIALSTMWSKFITLDKVAEEVRWLRNCIEDTPPKLVTALCTQCCDSMAALNRGEK